MTITQKQCLLMYLGYNPGQIDGIDGKKTQAAMAAFQAEWGMDETGLVDAVSGTAVKLEKPMEVDTSTGTFWDGIRYFARSEFACPCGCGGYPAEPKEKLVRLLDGMREHYGVPGVISSGVRCKKHNAAVKGAETSRHMLGQAADICFKGIRPADVMAYAYQCGAAYSYSIQVNGKDSGYVHIDIK